MAVECTVTESAKGKAEVVQVNEVRDISCIGAESGYFGVAGIEKQWNAASSDFSGLTGVASATGGPVNSSAVTITVDSVGYFNEYTITSDNTSNTSATSTVTQAGVAPEAAVNEVQHIAFDPTPTGGNWTISGWECTTGWLAYNANAAAVQAAIESDLLWSGQCSVSGNYVDGFDIEFLDTFAATDVDMLVVDDSELTTGGGGGGTAKVPIALFVGRAA